MRVLKWIPFAGGALTACSWGTYIASYDASTADEARAGGSASTSSSSGGSGSSSGSGNSGTSSSSGDSDGGGRGGADAAKDAPKGAAAACVDAGVNVATFDSGWPVWACFQAKCGAAGDAGGVGTLTACAADCPCNTAFAKALSCHADGGDTPSCFTPAVTSGDGGLQWYLQCFMSNMGCVGGDAGMMGDASTAD